MSFNNLQKQIEQQYDIQIPYCVDSFVCHDKALVRELAGTATLSPEMLLVQEAPGNLDLTLYLDKRLADTRTHTPQLNDLHDNTFEDYCTVLEGVSHFVYVVWNAGFGKSVKLVELELQAEVDKFVFAALAANESCDNQSQTKNKSQSTCTGLAASKLRAVSAKHGEQESGKKRRYQHQTQTSKIALRRLARRLFEQVTYMNQADSDLYARYKTANDLAFRYCSWLLEHFDIDHSNREFNAELARFYRMSARKKFRHIQTTPAG